MVTHFCLFIMCKCCFILLLFHFSLVHYCWMPKGRILRAVCDDIRISLAGKTPAAHGWHNNRNISAYKHPNMDKWMRKIVEWDNQSTLSTSSPVCWAWTGINQQSAEWENKKRQRKKRRPLTETEMRNWLRLVIYALRLRQATPC